MSKVASMLFFMLDLVWLGFPCHTRFLQAARPRARGSFKRRHPTIQCKHRSKPAQPTEQAEPSDAEHDWRWCHGQSSGCFMLFPLNLQLNAAKLFQPKSIKIIKLSRWLLTDVLRSPSPSAPLERRVAPQLKVRELWRKGLGGKLLQHRVQNRKTVFIYLLSKSSFGELWWTSSHLHHLAMGGF